jgi:hypothetical protein
MGVLNRQTQGDGDQEVGRWDGEGAALEEARQVFYRHLADGWAAFPAGRPGPVSQLDASEEEVLLIPHLVAG